MKKQKKKKVVNIMQVDSVKLRNLVITKKGVIFVKK
jgi:hypothetical protein